MRNPIIAGIETLHTAFHLRRATREARDRIREITSDGQQSSQLQKLIEFTNHRNPDDFNAQAQDLVQNLERGLEEGRKDEVVRGLKLLAMRYSFGTQGTAFRDGGIPTLLMRAMRERNQELSVSGQNPVFSNGFTDEVQEIHDEQGRFTYYDRRANLAVVTSTVKERYPEDHASELASGHPNEFRSRDHGR